MISQHLGSEVSVINKGIDGFTLSSVKRMWNQVKDHYSPDVISILVGINDIYMMETTGMDIPFALEEFKISFKTLLESIRKKYHGPILLMEPFIFPHPAEYTSWEPELHKMNAIIQQLATDHHLDFLPLWEDLRSIAKKEGYAEITTDGIHLTAQGHQLIASRWLSAYSKQNF